MKKIFVLILVSLFLSQGIFIVDSNSEKNMDCNQHDDFENNESSQTFYYGSTAPPDYARVNIIDTSEETPPEWDWRDMEYNGISGDWCSPVKNQGGCGSCWAFSTLGMIEAQINIMEGSPDLDVDLSEQYLLSCPPDSGGCCGWSCYEALEFLELSGGAIPEDCFPYQADDTIPCDEKCQNWVDFLIPIEDFKYYRNVRIDDIKSKIISFGPVSASFKVYEDFNRYTGGVYRHSSGEFEGYHAIVIVGYDDEMQCWICKNSWGEHWGEDGFFKIGYGECNIEDYIYSVDFNPETMNWPPHADCGGMYSAEVGEDINFDSSKTYDVDEDIISYEWDFGDGNTSIDLSPKHSYSKNGIYNIELVVTDSEGQQSIATSSVYIDAWNVEDIFVYSLSNRYDLNDFLIPLTIESSIDYLKMEVTDETTDTYTLSLSGKLNGEVSFDISEFLDSPIPLILSGKMKGTKMDIEVLMEKSGFSVSEITFEIKTRLSAKVKPIPIPLTVPVTFSSSISFNPSYSVFGFAPEPGRTWERPDSTFEVDGEIKFFYGLISKSFSLTNGSTSAFSMFGIGNKLNCIGMETITTDAGTFETYVIESLNGNMKIYFAPEVSTVVKIESTNSNENNYFTSELRSLEEFENTGE